MSFLTSLFTGGDSIKAIGDTVDKLFTSDEEKLSAKLEVTKAENDFKTKLAEMDTSLAMGQLDINKLDATSGNWVQTNWRPMVGWVCVASVAYTYLLEPLFRFLATVVFGYVGGFPQLNDDKLFELLLTMLGVAGLRTYEKVKGV